MGATFALIPAAGRGARFGAGSKSAGSGTIAGRQAPGPAPENKVFAPILGRPLLAWTLEAVARCSQVDHILLVGQPDEFERLRGIGETAAGGKFFGVIEGGDTRQESVRLGLAALPDDCEWVLIHDAARCCVTENIVFETLLAARHFRAATAAVALADSLVRKSGETVDRENIYAVQTPQAFRRTDLMVAHESARRANFPGTDDASLFRREFGLDSVAPVPGSAQNLKVTLPEDAWLAEAILRSRKGERAMFPELRVGHGYDVHVFAEGRPLWLGGVEYPDSPVGLLGHSDADALLHAVCDALLGAARMGDIGHLFPPSDDRHKDRRSIEFLEDVARRLRNERWRVENIDITVLAEYPKIAPKAAQMSDVISAAVGISAAQVSVKATTNEGMGFVGRREGIAVHATALLSR